ncbi:transposable element Tcb2 transposase [Trichonephila clavipes]|uniref:Transposable element Tcb2 transposase n=1 Tax=Trichonephila clavipes TaxID=2585209 RepID=A0A8X6W9A2_TRICX|nr:transposable element Tcb2 transposase [Trichonephila clavipes]
MSSRHHIDDFMRGRIIGKIEEGRKITDVARVFDIAHSVVSRLWKSFKTTGMCSRRHGGGRVRSTTPAEDRYIVLSAKRNRRTTAQQHRTARLQWCREHHNWTEQDWACVLFSDESRFSLSSDCRRQLIWRESGTAYRPENIQEKDRYPTCSIMVWAGIMINGHTRLHVVANGTMTGQRYIDQVLLPHVRLFRGAVGDKFVFMDDNATCHRTLAVQDCLDSEGIQRLVWSARSPDLNPIENVWDAWGRQVAGRNYPPTNKNTLIRALTEEWDKLPQQLLDNVVQSMRVVYPGPVVVLAWTTRFLLAIDRENKQTKKEIQSDGKRTLEHLVTHDPVVIWLMASAECIYILVGLSKQWTLVNKSDIFECASEQRKIRVKQEPSNDDMSDLGERYLVEEPAEASGPEEAEDLSTPQNSGCLGQPPSRSRASIARPNSK